MELFLTILGALLVLFGLIGTILPTLPGLPLIFVGFVLHAFATHFIEPSITVLAILGGITSFYYVVQLAAAPIATKAFGGTTWGAIGAFIGLLISVFLLPISFISIVFAPLFGAILGELLTGQSKRQAIKIGLGTTISFFLMTASEFGLGLGFAAYFVYLIIF